MRFYIEQDQQRDQQIVRNYILREDKEIHRSEQSSNQNIIFLGQVFTIEE